MIWNGHFEAIRSTLSQATDSITIVSPFITLDALESLVSDIADVQIRILTSWRKDDFIAGLASTSLAKRCLENGWCINVFHDGHDRKLHSKMYIADDTTVWMGSANLTHKGLGISSKSNYEVMTCMDSTPELLSHVGVLFAMSQRVDSNLVDHFLELENSIPSQPPIKVDWNAPKQENLFEALWSIMPPKPSAADFPSGTSIYDSLHLRGCRWGQFRRQLRQYDVTRDVSDDIISAFYDWSLSEYPEELDVQVAEPGGHTQCLVWRIDSLIQRTS